MGTASAGRRRSLAGRWAPCAAYDGVMISYPSAGHPTGPPALVGETHACADCGFSYPTRTVDDVLAELATLPARVAQAVTAAGPDLLRQRLSPGTWSVLEYACHLRDVLATSTIRLHRARTEVRPVVEPMLNDLRARRFRYNELDPAAVLAELAANAQGLRDEAGRVEPQDWERTVARLPGEERTARWLLRNALHEGIHHLADIQRGSGAA
ncbi:DinB superfamily [Frankia torreyi]|uniref:DinB superfamily n=2 Tax=Frankiaceae TaxID=74712 RepID=A0A0D8BJE1_9ACTN|nr:DinB superfamily [Frankia torreyi]KQM05471.1 DinB superfamily [Frankia sp. CpI1-P]